jgi:Membrane-bound lysozyme-inhibitor of c-type lysozyme
MSQQFLNHLRTGLFCAKPFTGFVAAKRLSKLASLLRLPRLPRLLNLPKLPKLPKLLLLGFVGLNIWTMTAQVQAQVFRFQAQNDTIKELASTVISGTYQCFNNQTVTVKTRADHLGYVDLSFKGHTHHMVPVPSNSGALRLESKAGGLFWLQLSTKSMLFTNAGSRVADDCRNQSAPPPPASTGSALDIQVIDLPTAPPPPPPSELEQKQLD